MSNKGRYALMNETQKQVWRDSVNNYRKTNGKQSHINREKRWEAKFRKLELPREYSFEEEMELLDPKNKTVDLAKKFLVTPNAIRSKRWRLKNRESQCK